MATAVGDLGPTVSTFENEGSMLLQNDTHTSTQYQPNSRMVTSNLYEIQDQGLKEGMSRDVLITQGLWTSADAEVRSVMTRTELDGEFEQPSLAKFDLPGAIFTKSEFIAAKFKNIAYFTADCEVTLRVQGTPFQQGILALAQIPYAKGTSRERRVYNEHLRSLTTFPHVKLNMQDPSRSVKLTVPFVNEYQNINPNDSDGLSSVRVWVLSTLAADQTENEKASYAITARLINIRLYGAAPSEPTRKSFSLGVASTQPWTKFGDNLNKKYPPVKPYPALRCQDGEDEMASSKGIISSVSNTVANVADVLTDVPVVSKIAKPIGWIARATAAVASYFGFSKPTDLEKNSVYSNVPARGFTHVEGIDQSVSLSLLPDNAINSTVAIASEKDEMAIATIAETPYVLERFNWTTDQTDGTIIMQIPVHPSPASTMASTVGDARVFFSAAIGLVTRLFHWWRGQPRVHFDFAKTQFHQGRLLIQYYPYGEGVQPLEAVNSHILDISQIDHTGFTIDFPSILRNKWLATGENSDGWSPETSAGVITVSVLSQLVAAPTVKQSVTIMPSMSWSNFEVSEQTANCKIAVAETYNPPSLGTGSLVETGEDNTVTFTTRLPAQVMLVSGNVATPISTTGSWTIVSGESGFSRELAYLSEDTVFGVFRKSVVDIPAGTYTIKADQLNVDAEKLKFFISRPITLSSGTLVSSNVTYYLGAKPEGSNVTQPNWQVSLVGCTIDYEKASPTARAYINDGSDVDLLAYKNTALTGWLSTLYRFSTGSASAFESGLTDGVWLVLQDAPTLKSQDFQEGDESSRTTTMGEIVPSLRALTRRFTLDRAGNGFVAPLGSVSVGTPVTLRQSLFNIVSWLYRFTSGSIRHKIISSSGGLVAVVTANKESLGTSAVPTALDITGASHIQDLSLNPIVEVTVPFYSPAENLAISSTTFPLSQYFIGTLSGEDFEYQVLTAAGDDHTFSFRVGCPAFTA